MKRLIVFLFSVFAVLQLHAQTPRQVVSGKVVDAESQQALPGVIVRWRADSSNAFTVTTDAQGRFRMKAIPTGRHDFEFRLLGYELLMVPDVAIGAGKEVVLQIEMKERFTEMEAIEIKASNPSETLNELTLLSARQFRIEETERYPGSRQDPARMASNFAGVQGTNDTRNDIVVRGNSPSSTLWRLDDIDIPNPNHFAVPGSMGGPVSILNNKYLGNSDFLTGAFPAQYGNANGGVFDVKMRNGNADRFEHTFQFGVLGTELASEGPINKKTGASYLATYRYSTLDLLQGLNLRIGTDAVPQYQDAGFRILLPTKKAGTFALWGIGGISNINIVVSALDFKEVLENESYGDKNRDQYFNTRMGVLGLSHTLNLNTRSWMKTVVSTSAQDVKAHHDLILRSASGTPLQPFPRIMDYRFLEKRITMHLFVQTKWSGRSTTRTGIMATWNGLQYYDHVKAFGFGDSIPQLVIDSLPWKTRVDYRGGYATAQAYFHWKYRLTQLWTFSAGLYAQASGLNARFVAEPRVALNWQVRENQKISLGAGLHSQNQLNYLCFAAPDTLIRNGVKVANSEKLRDNQGLKFSRSLQSVLGYDLQLGPMFRIRAEAYYQQLWDIPVYALASGISLINQGASFSRFFPVYSMANRGTGRNQGIELTIEKFFSKHYFFLVSGSLYDSKYTASNGKTYDTDYNGRFILNALTGVEFPVGKSRRNAWSAGTKVTYAGGRRYSPVDVNASAVMYDVVPVESAINSLQFPDYFRWDLRLAYKIHRNRTKEDQGQQRRGRTHEIAVDLINVLNIRNVLALSYSPDPQNPQADPLAKTYQLGFLPLFYYKLDF